jgi:hypothetical protein
MSSNIGTLIPLAAESNVAGFTHILRLTYKDVLQLTSATLQAVVPNNALASATAVLPAGMHVSKVVPYVAVAFTASAGTLTTLTFILGDDGSTNRYVAAMDAMTKAWGIAYTGKFVYVAANTIDIIFTLNTNSTAVISSVATLSAGQIDFYLQLQDCSKLVNTVEPDATA